MRARRRGGARSRLRRLAAAWALAAAAAACQEAHGVARDLPVEGGDPARGKALIASIGCGSCHVVPGINEAQGLVGPPLIHWSRRRVIAGELTNTPEHLVTWITVPQAVEPGTDMPNLGVTDGQARDIAAYLFTLH